MRTLTIYLTACLCVSACRFESGPTIPGAAEGESPATVDFSAHWVRPQIILVRKAAETRAVRLYHSDSATLLSLDGSIDLTDRPFVGLLDIPTPTGFRDRFRGLSADYSLLAPEPMLGASAIKDLLKNQLLITQHDGSGVLLKVSQVQTARLLDDLYTYGPDDADELTDYGATINARGVQFRLWAPTAREAEVLLFGQDKNPAGRMKMIWDPQTGAWTAQGGPDIDFVFYQYGLSLYHPATRQIETLVVTDPYSLSLSTNSVYSQVVDLSDPRSQPPGWEAHRVNTVNAYEDSILYEVHIRDFSASDSSLSNPGHRGKYKAFSEPSSNGVQHLKALAAAGLTHIHLLPAFDLSSINEDLEQTIFPDDSLEKVCRIAPEAAVCDKGLDRSIKLQTLLKSYSNRSGDVQALLEVIRDRDPYNWGYDPFHYTVPEGSYAVNPDGISRIVEFREMVKSIHNMGYRVIMDVVYNHTFASGLAEKSVLDKIVPNYYQRLNSETGAIEQSTCCDNTATEHVMMGKLMMDSLVVWARDYKIDGFRFDLMGHQPKPLMLEAYDKVREVDPDTYFYGEGWNFGEVADNRLFVQATQGELGGTEIGTFSDRMRDAVRGGSYNAMGLGLRQSQGVGNGLYTIPNETQPEDGNLEHYRLYADRLRVGLAGNLANFPLENASGESVTGKDIPYGGSATGYALDPADTINYVSKHDNQTLWDNHQYRTPYDVSTEDRVRMQTMSLAFPMLAQGVPFIHMGSELLRSKSFLRDSYDYGDWFNAVDFSMQTNNYDVGLPPAVKDEANWALIQDLLEQNEGRDQVTAEHIRYSATVFKEWLGIRSGSPLFRLTTEAEVVQRVSFHNTGPNQRLGLIVMRLSDQGLERDLDALYQSILVVFNLGARSQTVQMASSGYQLHPIQAEGADGRLIAAARVTGNGFDVPGLSAAVFVLPQ